MHQFGLHQHILDDVDTLDDLYVVNHRGIMDDDWSVVHIEYVNLWHTKEITYLQSDIHLLSPIFICLGI